VSASLGKTMLLAAFLRRGAVRSRELTRAEKALLGPMIRRSDNPAAHRVHAIVGHEGLDAVARAVGMRDYGPGTSWGLRRTSARDQALLFWRLERILPQRHRAYAKSLLASVVAWQRWGIAEVVPAGWKLYFKGGWGIDPGNVNHQVALLVKGDRRIALAITTRGNPSHTAGTTTLRGVARRLLRGLR